MSDDLHDLYQQVILDHCKNPRHFREMPAASCSAQGRNPLCGDQLQLFLQLEKGVVHDATFLGSGCCISKASASLMTDSVRGKNRAEIQSLFDAVHRLITTGQGGEELGKLAVFAGVYKYPARVKCAILAWHALLAALDGRTDPVSTETERS